jgi:hypothetical protein
MRALPGDKPLTAFRVRHSLSETVFSTSTDALAIETAVFGDRSRDELVYQINLRELSGHAQQLRAACFVDWLMGSDSADAPRTRAWNHNGALLAAGAMDATAYLVSDIKSPEFGPSRSNFLGHGGVMQPDGLAG